MGPDFSQRRSWDLKTPLPQTSHRCGQALLIKTIGGQDVVSSADTERRLAVITTALDHFLDRCEDTVDHADRSVLCWLRSNVSHRPYKAPFLMASRNSTRTRYRSIFKRLFCLCGRLYCLDPGNRKSMSRLPSRPELYSAIGRLWEDDWWKQNFETLQTTVREGSLNVHGEGSEFDDDISEDSNEDNDAMSDDDGEYSASTDHRSVSRFESEPKALSQGEVRSKPRSTTLEPQPLDRLSDMVGALAEYLCTETCADGMPESTLIVYFSGILGFNPDATTFLQARAYTSYLSALAYCIRLTVLESTLPRFAHPIVGWPMRPSTDQADRLKDVHAKYLGNTCQAPMGELLSLRSYGRAISRTDGPCFRVRWSGDRQMVSWPGGSLDLAQF